MTPFEWLENVRDCALDVLEDSDFVDVPSIVEIGDMKSTAGSADCCGALYIDGGTFYEFMDRFPDRHPATKAVAAFKGCNPGVAMPIRLRYVHCVPVFQPNAGGAAPTNEQREEYARLLWGVAWEMWNGLSCCIKEWRKQFRLPVVLHELTPQQRQGGFSGFEISMTAALAGCRDCSE